MKRAVRISGIFAEKVRTVVAAIQPGSTLSYAAVARLAGYPRAARAVGTLMKSNFDPHIPCHRVVRSGGLLGEYNRGSDRKEILLKSEGVKIFRGAVIMSANYDWPRARTITTGKMKK